MVMAMAMENKRLRICKEIEQKFAGRCTIFGKGKTAKATKEWIEKHTCIKEFHFIVDDEYAECEEESLSCYMGKCSSGGPACIVFGFSDWDRAMFLTKEVFSPKGIKTYFFPFPFCFNETGKYIDKDYYQAHWDMFARTRRLLEDNSKDLYDVYIEAQITGEVLKLDVFREAVSQQYLRENCFPKAETDVIDVGAYTGDTIPYMMDKLLVSNYIAMEPDKTNILRLREYLKDKKITNVEIIEAGAWDDDTSLNFSSSGSSSEIVEHGDCSIRVIKLDTIAPHLNDEKELFIKMDIEGAEYRALCGANELIKSRKPYLAVSVYHNIDDLIRIPQYIESLNPGKYKYELGYYGNNFRELVLYAAPI